MIEQQTIQGKNNNHRQVFKDSLLEQLEDGTLTDIDYYVRMVHESNVKPERVTYERSEDSSVDYLPFVRSTEYKMDGSGNVVYGEPKPFEVTIRRSSGDIEDNWSAIGLAMYINKDGYPQMGYLVTKPQEDEDGNVVEASRINDIVETEKLTHQSEAKRQQKIAGSFATHMS